MSVIFLSNIIIFGHRSKLTKNVYSEKKTTKGRINLIFNYFKKYHLKKGIDFDSTYHQWRKVIGKHIGKHILIK